MNNVVEFSRQDESACSEQPAPGYAELAVTTNFSFLRGASKPDELVTQAMALGLSGIGIADRNSVAGVVRAYSAIEQINDQLRNENKTAPPFKLAVGARLVFADGTPDILAYPQNRAAWGRLTRLLTVGKSRGEKAECVLFFDDLLEHSSGLNLIVMPPTWLSKQAQGAAAPLPLRGDGAGSGRRETHHGLRDATPTLPAIRFANGKERTALAAPSHGGSDLEHVLTVLKAAAPRSVWLAASMLYRGDDNRRLARLGAIAETTLVPLIAVNDVL